MSRKRRARLRALVEELARRHPELADPEALIESGVVRVDGWLRTSPQARVRPGASITIAGDARLRGETKLAAALDKLEVEIRGRIALDVGAAAGGFTRALLAGGAAKVYAVDAGHGQLLGSLRQDARVVNLEATNLGELDRALVPEPIDVVTIDVSYLSLAQAVPQLRRVAFAPAADALALVKPQFELRTQRQPPRSRLREAVDAAAEAFRRCGWDVAATIESPVRGAGGSIEFFVHARLRSGGAG